MTSFRLASVASKLTDICWYGMIVCLFAMRLFPTGVIYTTANLLYTIIGACLILAFLTWLVAIGIERLQARHYVFFETEEQREGDTYVLLLTNRNGTRLKYTDVDKAKLDTIRKKVEAHPQRYGFQVPLDEEKAITH